MCIDIHIPHGFLMVLHRKTHDTMVEPSKKNIADESKKEWADATDE